VRDLVLSDNHFLFENLDGVEVIRRLLTTENNLAEGPFAKNLDEFEVFKRLQSITSIYIPEAVPIS
jgi:hypothetical protein